MYCNTYVLFFKQANKENGYRRVYSTLLAKMFCIYEKSF